MRHAFHALLGVAFLGSAGAAAAEPARPHVIALPTVHVSGRVQTPLAAVEVARVEPRLTLKALEPSFTDRIARAVVSDPY